MIICKKYLVVLLLIAIGALQCSLPVIAVSAVYQFRFYANPTALDSVPDPSLDVLHTVTINGNKIPAYNSSVLSSTQQWLNGNIQMTMKYGDKEVSFVDALDPSKEEVTVLSRPDYPGREGFLSLSGGGIWFFALEFAPGNPFIDANHLPYDPFVYGFLFVYQNQQSYIDFSNLWNYGDTSRLSNYVVNSAPVIAPTGGGVYQINTPVILGGQVFDADGDALSYQWLEGKTVLFNGTVPPTTSPYNLTSHIIEKMGLGVHTLTLVVSDGFKEPVSANITVEVVDTIAPVLCPAPDRSILWPPNNKMVPVTIIINASDNSGGPVSVKASVSCNEVQKVKGKNGNSQAWTEPVIANGLIKLELLAAANGNKVDRVYTITIEAKDQSQNRSVAKVNVVVPPKKN